MSVGGATPPTYVLGPEPLPRFIHHISANIFIMGASVVIDGSNIKNKTEHTIWLIRMDGTKIAEIAEGKTEYLSKKLIDRFRISFDNDSNAWVVKGNETWEIPEGAEIELWQVDEEDGQVLEVTSIVKGDKQERKCEAYQPPKAE
ncbi:hypothetical protein CPB83DRAFT_911611 [Crepidotus variabilis]|uniref:Uncharacterized protein n=1 Tax=Crepidotus variabilis TaxID=179855 RepID=A0A9P6JI14_9AGAR|nr:hypothetical protein CPB83DRAFT_911611 [Crepidotus variabilis]